MSEGLGPTSFDCSGLVIRSICDVLGMSTDQWPVGLRHVRDIWKVAERDNTQALQRTRPTVGSLAITGRYYTVFGEEKYIPYKRGY